MKKLLAVFLFGLASAAIAADDANGTKVEVKGPHICCKGCVKVAEGILKKVDGVSDAKADVETKTVTFTAKDAKAAKAGVMALVSGGFFGTATGGDKAIKFKTPAAPPGKAASVTVKDVHVCCGQCQKAITKLFPDAKVSFEGKGPQRSVLIEGTDLDRAAVLGSLHKSGFNGTVEK